MVFIVLTGCKRCRWRGFPTLRVIKTVGALGATFAWRGVMRAIAVLARCPCLWVPPAFPYTTYKDASVFVGRAETKTVNPVTR